ncbi:GNAT family protein [Macrococcus capreoli]|uniref:GNAT family N-acetyltransferase n=1 Tax=Macrococcus capreoli TaxID=2982690 RepID=UPI0021D5B1F7|nr:GNAT family protein [Macrococcus sp. TMW 2.2395]MCU7556703.1 GNAT family N-acetyltransferase [Macrococcus sp. TMW 2.2395]
MTINVFESVVLENERIKLIPMQIEHAKDLHAINHESIWSYMLFKATDMDLMEQWVIDAVHLREKMKSIPFIVVMKETNEVVGSTRIKEIDYENDSCEIGTTWFGVKAQKTYVNTDSKYLLLEFCFETLNMVRVQIRADERNERSNRAIERLGFQKEGVIRKERNLDGVRRNLIIYSIIDDEWPDVKENIKRIQEKYNKK